MPNRAMPDARAWRGPRFGLGGCAGRYLPKCRVIGGGLYSHSGQQALCLPHHVIRLNKYTLEASFLLSFQPYISHLRLQSLWIFFGRRQHHRWSCTTPTQATDTSVTRYHQFRHLAGRNRTWRWLRLKCRSILYGAHLLPFLRRIRRRMSRQSYSTDTHSRRTTHSR